MNDTQLAIYNIESFLERNLTEKETNYIVSLFNDLPANTSWNTKIKICSTISDLLLLK